MTVTLTVEITVEQDDDPGIAAQSLCDFLLKKRPEVTAADWDYDDGSPAAAAE